MTRRVSHLLMSLVLSLGFCLAAVGAVGRSPTAHADAPSAPAAWPVALGILSISPTIPNALTDDFVMKGPVRNDGKKTYSVSVRLQITRMTTRWDAATQPPNVYDSRIVSKAVAIQGNTLTPQARSTWQTPAGLKVKDLLSPWSPARQSGVFALDAVAVDTSTGDILGVQRTFLVYKPLAGGDHQAVYLALTWPVTAPPALTGGTNAGGFPVLADTDGLTTQIAPDGRLDHVVTQGTALGKTANWVVDPDLLYTVGKMKSGYAMPGNADLAGGDTAGHWLTSAQNALHGQNCWNVPYGDPDLASLAQSPQGLSLLKTALSLSSATTQTCDRQGQVLAWPGAGQSDRATTAAIHQYLPNAPALVTNTFYKSNITTARATLDGGVNALVSDTYLDDVFAPGDPAGLSDPGVLAGQRWLAQTAMMAREDITHRTVIAAPPRDFDPSPGLTEAIQKEDSLKDGEKWINFQPLSAVLDQKPGLNLTSPAQQSAANAKTDLAPALIQQSATTQSLWTAFLTVLESGGEYDRAVPFRMVSTSWRGQPGPAGEYADAVQKQVTSMHNGVYLTQVSPLTLSGKSGKIPITIRNDLAVPVTVYIEASSQLGNRLSVAEQPGKVTVQRNATATVQIPVRAVGSGTTVQLVAQLRQPGQNSKPGDLYYPVGTGCDAQGVCLGTVVAKVKVSAIGLIALALMIGSAAVLVVAIGLRVLRANRAHHTAGHDTMAS